VRSEYWQSQSGYREALWLTCGHPAKQVLRQSYCSEAQRLGYASKEPTYQDSPTRWKSTHEMRSNALRKREVLDLMMMLYEEDLETGPLSDLEWSKICAVMDFLRAPRLVMESLALEHKSSIDLVELIDIVQ
jgi:hypothetical protein